MIFKLDELRFALHVSAVERVIWAAEVTPLPGAPSILLGVLNVRGKIIPVVNLRRRLGLTEREIEPSDQLIIGHTSSRPLALIADAVTGVIELPEENVIAANRVFSNPEYVEGVVKLEGDLVLIHDLDTFLSFGEETALDAALRADS